MAELEVDFERRLGDKDVMLNEMCADLQDEVAAVKDERDELVQRLRMTERQLARAQKPEVRPSLPDQPKLSDAAYHTGTRGPLGGKDSWKNS